jgi:hypothetical protein
VPFDCALRARCTSIRTCTNRTALADERLKEQTVTP